MNRRTWTCLFALVLGIGLANAGAQTPAEKPKEPLAEEVYKNIQVLKGAPASRMDRVMNNLNRWLGVECGFCHVPDQWDSEEKPAKQMARKMFGLVRTIGKEPDGGGSKINCWTCHRGQSKPEFLPKSP